MSNSARSIRIMEVQHASAVAAVPTSEGPRAILDAGLREALGSGGARVELLRLSAPPGTVGAVGDAFAIARRVAASVRQALEEGYTPVVLSGSCHPALGSYAGLSFVRRGVIWLDCHGDFNTPDTTESGLLDGMVLATIAGRCWRRLALSVPGFEPIPESNVVLVGAREFDHGEERLLAEAPIPRLTTADVRERRFDAIEMLATQVDAVYVHLDLDVLDPSVGRANRYSKPGGLLLDDFVQLLGAVSASFSTKVVGMSSYDPREDPDSKVASAAVRGAAALILEST